MRDGNARDSGGERYGRISGVLLACASALALPACGKGDNGTTRAVTSAHAATAQVDTSAVSRSAATSTATPKHRSLRAIFTCETQGYKHTLLAHCFGSSSHGTETKLELRNGDKYDLYSDYTYERAGIGRESGDGFIVDLKDRFEIKIQNGGSPNGDMILGLRIVDVGTGEVAFEKKVQRFGVISIKN